MLKKDTNPFVFSHLERIEISLWNEEAAQEKTGSANINAEVYVGNRKSTFNKFANPAIFGKKYWISESLFKHLTEVEKLKLPAHQVGVNNLLIRLVARQRKDNGTWDLFREVLEEGSNTYWALDMIKTGLSKDEANGFIDKVANEITEDLKKVSRSIREKREKFGLFPKK